MSENLPKVAVVLGGGGIKPYSAIPLISFLQEQNIQVDLLVGCSGGSIMSALWSYGYTPDQMLNDVAPRLKKSTFKTNWKALLAVGNLPFGRMDKHTALIHAGPIRKVMKDLWGDTRLEDLKTKTIIQVTDFETGEGIGLETGLLADCVYASSAIFPLLPPLKMGERYLFDGAFTAPVPILQAIRHKVDIIIVVDFLEKVQTDPKGLFDNLVHTGKLNAKTIGASQMALSIDINHAEIIYIKVVFEHFISFWEIDKFPEILNAGQIAMGKVKDEILLVYNHLRQKMAEEAVR